jgi:hypothetical protein
VAVRDAVCYLLLFPGWDKAGEVGVSVLLIRTVAPAPGLCHKAELECSNAYSFSSR